MAQTNAINSNRTLDPNGVYWSCTATLDSLTADLPDPETVCATGTIVRPIGIIMGATVAGTLLNLSITNGAGVEFARLGCAAGGPPTYVPFDHPQMNGIILNPIALAAASATVIVTVFYKFQSGTAPTVV